MSDQKLHDSKKPSGPVKIRSLKMWVDRDLCIGAATCVAVAPQTFVLDSEAKAIILNTAEKESDKTIVESAKSCPVAAIFIEDQNGKKIFPK